MERDLRRREGVIYKAYLFVYKRAQEKPVILKIKIKSQKLVRA